MSGYGIRALVARATILGGRSYRNGILIASRTGTEPRICETHLNHLPYLSLAKIHPNFAAIARSNSSASPVAAMAPKPTHRKVYVIGVGMTKVGIGISFRDQLTNSHLPSLRNRDGATISITQRSRRRLCRRRSPTPGSHTIRSNRPPSGMFTVREPFRRVSCLKILQ